MRLHSRMAISLRIGISLILLALVALAAERGLRLRGEVWDRTTGVHFEGDVSNGFNWGSRAYREGIFQLYSNLENGVTSRGSSTYALDYPPLRLAMVTLWARWARVHYPNAREWEDSYAFTAPMLRANTIAEALSCGLVFLIILLLQRRMHAANLLSQPPPNLRRAIGGFLICQLIALLVFYFSGSTWNAPVLSQWWIIPSLIGGVFLGSAFTGLSQALFGAMVLWFNPAIVWDGHCWPQWDVWLVPFFLAAVLLACLDWWLVAGVCLAIGACLKGQLLLGAPILLIWPICQFRFGAALRLVAGIVLAIAAIALPWLNAPPAVAISAGLLILALACVAPFVLRWKIPAPWMIALMAIALLLAWPWKSSSTPSVRVLPLALVGAAAMLRFIPAPRLIPHCYALAIGLSILLMMPVYHVSSAWYEIGFASASEKYHEMLTGRGTFNLPAVMRSFYGWPQYTDDPTHLPFITEPVTFRTSMVILYAICLLLLGIGAAINYRRRDVRFLIAIAAPWVIAYCVMTQMHGRYLVWGAAMSALLAGAGWGMALLGILVSVIAWLGMVYNQYYFETYWDLEHFDQLSKLVPNLGWMLLLAAVIYLYMAVVPRSRRI